MLNQTNIGQNNNKFYVIQVLENGNNLFYNFTRWGRVVSEGCQRFNDTVLFYKFTVASNHHYCIIFDAGMCQILYYYVVLQLSFLFYFLILSILSVVFLLEVKCVIAPTVMRPLTIYIALPTVRRHQNQTDASSTKYIQQSPHNCNEQPPTTSARIRRDKIV